MAPVPLPASRGLNELLRQLPEVPQGKAHLVALRTCGAIHHYRGEQHAAVALLRRALTSADELADWTTQKMALSYLNRALFYLGDYEAALSCAERLHAQARAADDAMWRHFAHMMLSALKLYHGELADALSHAEQSAAGAPEQQRHWVLSLQAQCLAKLGRPAESAALLADALSGFERQPINALMGVEDPRRSD